MLGFFSADTRCICELLATATATFVRYILYVGKVIVGRNSESICLHIHVDMHGRPERYAAMH